MKAKFKKTSTKEIPGTCKNIAPISAAQICKKLYPSLTKIKLSKETRDNVYYDVGDISLEGQSRFFSSVYATVKPDIESDAATKSPKPGDKCKGLGQTEKKPKMYNMNVPSGSEKEHYEILERNQEDYNKQHLKESLDKEIYENCNKRSTLKVSGRRSGVLGHKNNLQTDDETLMNKTDVQTDHKRIVNSDVASDQSSNGGVNVYSKIVNQDDEAETVKDNAKDQDNSGGVGVDGKTSNKALTMKPTPKDIVEPEAVIYDDIRSSHILLSQAPLQQSSAPKPKQSSTIAARKYSNPMVLPLPPLPPRPSKTSSVQLANRPQMPIPQSTSSSTTLRRSASAAATVSSPSSTKTTAAAVATEIRNPSKTLKPIKMVLSNRPPLPIPATPPPPTTPPPTTPPPTTPPPTTPPTTTTTAEAAEPTYLSQTITKTSKSPQHKPEKSTESSMTYASVKELCLLLENCGLQRIKDICQENCLDGYFISKLPDSSLQESPFNLSSIEMMKLKMMLQGWRPKME